MTEVDSGAESDNGNVPSRSTGGVLSGLAELQQLSGIDQPQAANYVDVDDWEKLRFSGKDASLLRQHIKAFLRRQQTAGKTLQRDKWAFVTGVLGFILSAYWLGASPTTFYKLYSAAALVLFALRWIIYQHHRAHYYLFDACYAIHFCLLLHLWVFPDNAFLHKVTFAYAMGPLCWSVVAFRNSLVFHSLDKVTSLFLHIYPAGVVWSERWHPDARRRALLRRSVERMHDWDTATLSQMVLLPLLPYLCWAILYYVKIFIISSEKIQKRNYETLFKYLTKAHAGNPISKMVLSVPPQWQSLSYMCLHLSLTTMTFAIARVLWASFYINTLFMLWVLMVSAANGAAYYFTYFAQRYAASIAALSQEPKDDRGDLNGG